MMCWSNLTSTRRCGALSKLPQREAIGAPPPSRKAANPRQHAPPNCKSSQGSSPGLTSARLPRYSSVMQLQIPTFAAACVAWLVITALPAQEARAARVTIHVTDQTGAAIANAGIRLIPSPASRKTKLTTDDNGQVALELKPGGYGLFIEEPSFKKLVTHLEVRESSEEQTIPVVLEIGNMGSPTVYPPSFKDALVLEAFPYHEPMALHPAELQAMPHTKVTVHNPHTNADETYSGIPLHQAGSAPRKRIPWYSPHQLPHRRRLRRL
jgi:hypothetical protein